MLTSRGQHSGTRGERILFSQKLTYVTHAGFFHYGVVTGR